MPGVSTPERPFAKMAIRCSSINIPIKRRKHASYAVGRYVSKAIECSIERKRQFSFLGKFEIFVARKLLVYLWVCLARYPTAFS
jgi:hypothetical protein